MSKEKVFIDSWGVNHSELPVPTVTNYHKDVDDYIIEYQEVEHVKLVGDKDTDFIKTVTVEESSRVSRQKTLNEQSGDVGILNIMKKMALSGDESLLNQTNRVSLPGLEKDALGRAVEDVVDISNYQVDKIEALNSYKKGAAVFGSLDPDLKGKKSLEDIAKMSDKEIDDFISNKVKAIYAEIAKSKSVNTEESEK